MCGGYTDEYGTDTALRWFHVEKGLIFYFVVIH